MRLVPHEILFLNINEISKQINDILDGTRDLPQFDQPEHAGVCSAGPLLIGAFLVCNNTRERLSTSGNVTGGQETTRISPSNWQIDEAQKYLLTIFSPL